MGSNVIVPKKNSRISTNIQENKLLCAKIVVFYMNYSAVLDILRIAIPLLAVLGLVYMMLKNFQENENKKFLLELQKDTKKQSFPMRLQAYERLVLLAERLEPAAQFSRLSLEAETSAQIQMMMLVSVQQEFEHNLAQQIYISTPVWAQFVKAKEQLISIIQKTGTQVPKDASTQEFAKALFAQLEKTPPTDLLIAKSALKEEIANFL